MILRHVAAGMIQITIQTPMVSLHSVQYKLCVIGMSCPPYCVIFFSLSLSPPTSAEKL